MKKSTQFYLAVIVAFLILVSLTIIAVDFFTPKGYIAVVENVDFVSQTGKIADVFSEIRKRQEFIVSPAFYEAGAINAYMTQSLTLFTSILIGNGKKVISLPRVLSQNKELLYCQTNDGDVLGNRETTVEECNSYLSDEGFVKIKVALPDNSLPKSRVNLDYDSIEIYPKNYEEISRVSYLVIKTMYDNSEEIIAQINYILQKVG